MSSEKRVRLELFSDYVCPWCYLHSASTARLLQEQPVKLRWRHFPLHPDTPQQGLSLEQLFQGRDMSEMQQRLEQLIRDAGLPYNPQRDHTYNTRQAQELAAWAEDEAGLGIELHQALFQAYFVDNRNLAEHQVLLDVAEGLGLERGAAAAALEARAGKDAVDEDWRAAREYGLNGVPALIGGGYLLSGYQPYEELERFLRHVEMQEARA